MRLMSQSSDPEIVTKWWHLDISPRNQARYPKLRVSLPLTPPHKSLILCFFPFFVPLIFQNRNQRSLCLDAYIFMIERIPSRECRSVLIWGASLRSHKKVWRCTRKRLFILYDPKNPPRKTRSQSCV